MLTLILPYMVLRRVCNVMEMHSMMETSSPTIYHLISWTSGSDLWI